MPFNIKIDTQVAAFENSLKKDLYQKLHEASKTKPHWISLAALPIGITSGFLIVATQVETIAERLFKGVINIVGSLFCVDQCSFSTGMGMLAKAVAGTAIGLPFSLLNAVVGLFTKTFGFFFDPEGMSYQFWMNHDPVEKARNDRKIQATEAEETLKNNPEDDQAMVTLADWAKEEKRYENWHTYCKKAADLGNMNALYQMGMYYLSSGDKDKADGLLNQAAQKGYVPAKIQLKQETTPEEKMNYWTKLLDPRQMKEIVEALKEKTEI